MVLIDRSMESVGLKSGRDYTLHCHPANPTDPKELTYVRASLFKDESKKMLQEGGRLKVLKSGVPGTLMVCFAGIVDRGETNSLFFYFTDRSLLIGMDRKRRSKQTKERIAQKGPLRMAKPPAEIPRPQEPRIEKPITSPPPSHTEMKTDKEEPLHVRMFRGAFKNFLATLDLSEAEREACLQSLVSDKVDEAVALKVGALKSSLEGRVIMIRSGDPNAQHLIAMAEQLKLTVSLETLLEG